MSSAPLTDTELDALHERAIACFKAAGDQLEAMPLEEAKRVVRALIGPSLNAMGVPSIKRETLDGVSLADCVFAAHRVKLADEASIAAQRRHGGTLTLSVIPDERLIAAVFALARYHPNNEPIAIIDGRGIFVLPIKEEQ